MSVLVDHEAVEQVSEILSRACPGGVVVEAAFDALEEGLAARLDTRRPAVVRGYVTAIYPAAARAAVASVRRDLGHLQAFAVRPIGELETRLVQEEDWAEAWKEHFPVMRIGRRIVIRPTWRSFAAAASDVVMALDPGMAFGTGLHPTTRLCLRGIEHLADRALIRGARVLDVGTGSGILAIAAGLLGAASVVAVDTDPLAVEVCRRNAKLNGLTNVVARRGTLPVADGPFDVVLANLVAGLLVDLSAELAAAVKPGGVLIASGIFHEREAEVSQAFGSADLRVVDRLAEDDWVAVEAVRRV